MRLGSHRLIAYSNRKSRLDASHEIASLAGGIVQVTFISSTEYHDISRRVRAEFREMPGLVLTETQAQRMWSLEPQTCRHVLALLVHEGFLVHTGQGYLRLDSY